MRIRFWEQSAVSDLSATNRSDRRSGAWLVSAAAILLAPILIFARFPSQDGPAHLNSALALLGLADGRPPFADYFFARSTDPTNAAVTIILQALSHVAPADQLERLYVGLYVLIFCGVAWLCIRHILKAGVASFLLLCTLVFSHMLHMGSYNLTLAYTGFLLVIALCCAHLREPRGFRLAAIAAALLGTYFLHVQVAILAAVCVGLTGAAMLLRAVIEKPSDGRGHAAAIWAGVRQTGWLALCGLPTAAFFLVYYLRNAEGLEAVSHVSHVGLVGKGVHLALLSGVANYSVFGLAVCGLLAALLIVLGVFALGELRGRGLRPHDLLGAFAIVLAAIYVVMPNGLGEVLNIEERVMIPLLMTVICWLGVSTRLVAKPWVAGAAFALLALQTTDRLVAFRHFNLQAAQALSLRTCLPTQGAVMVVDLDLVARLPVVRDWRRPFDSALRFEPFANVGGMILGDRPIAWANNYQAEIPRLYFALKQQPWLVDLLGPENVTFALWREGRTGAFTQIVDRMPAARHPVDYLILWSTDPKARQAPRVTAAWRGVRAAYQEVAASPDRSAVLLRLKTARGPAGPCAPKGESPA